MKPKILLFAGAGASMAVNGEQFPTTIEFFNRLPTTITDLPLFQQLIDLIQARTGKRVDIEQVLWALDELRRDLKGLHDGSSVLGYCMKPPNYVATVGQLTFGQLDLAIDVLLTHSDNLTSEINKLVYDLYSYDPTATELSKNWIPWLRLLWEASDELNIFTTNYDGVIESALSSICPLSELDAYLGLSGERRKYVNLKSWEDVPVDGKGLLTKLHGSVDWKRSGSRINISDAGFAGDHERHPIIYPGFKGAASAEFFDVFHSYLGYAVGEADILIFIGFAFRDEHINSIIRDALRDEAQVVIIDPNSKVQFCSTRIDPVRLKEFGKPRLDIITTLLDNHQINKPRRQRRRI
jgi:hypothetical protein